MLSSCRTGCMALRAVMSSTLLSSAGLEPIAGQLSMFGMTSTMQPHAVGISRPLSRQLRMTSLSASDGRGSPATPSDPFHGKLQSKTEEQLLELIMKNRAAKLSEAGEEEHEHAAEEGDDLVEVVNNETGERMGPRGKEPTRYGDWENKGRCTDF